MNRDRSYYRKMRQKHIQRKKRICKSYPVIGWWYLYDGMYSKNKIHCSCRMCREKDYFGRHIQTLQEKRSDDNMKQQIEDIDLG